ncbi:MAG: transglycosylase SLT domain-containing protein [Bradymonadales bacterium]|nr:transglycosylase SLT domain-containing protein [Bradymonadales bacterium]
MTLGEPDSASTGEAEPGVRSGHPSSRRQRRLVLILSCLCLFLAFCVLAAWVGRTMRGGQEPPWPVSLAIAPADSFSASLPTEPTSVPEVAQAEPEGEQLPTCAERAGMLLHHAVREARSYAHLDRGRRTLTEARLRLRSDPQAAVSLVQRVLEVGQSPESSSQAYWILGSALMALEEYEGSLQAFLQVGETAVPDYLELRIIEVLLALGERAEAVRRAHELVDSLRDSSSPAVHSARELYLTALFTAGRWRALVREGLDFLERYPDYRRPDRLRLWLGLAELNLGRWEEAADHLDQVVWNYPYRPAAHQAWWAMQVLRGAGVRMPAHSLSDRMDRALALRINKHWEIAGAALQDLLADVLSLEGEGSFANQVRMEMWRNSYGAGDFTRALIDLEEVLDRQMEGMRPDTVYSALADTYARLGRFEEGVEALRARNQGRSRSHLHSELSRYYRENGFYRQALEHAEQLRGARQRPDWDHTLLLFLAGQTDQAAEGFRLLAERAGSVSQPRLRYWQARALMGSGEPTRAGELFDEIRTRWPLDYYGLQADNRLYELTFHQEPSVVWREENGDSPDGERTGGLPHATLEELATSLVRHLNLRLTGFVRREFPGPAGEVTNDEESRAPDFPARIHWDGPLGVADSYLTYQAGGHAIEGAYLSWRGEEALDALSERAAGLFPALARARFLYLVGESHEAQLESREASIEFYALNRSFRQRRPSRSPVQLDYHRFEHLVDRRSVSAGLWGIALDRLRYDIGQRRAAQQEMLARQQAIYDQRFDLQEGLVDGLMVLQDHHMVRRFTTTRLGWDTSPPEPDQRESWSVSYPRAYPELVVEHSERYGVNPYIIWSLMVVESSFNPDAVSRSDARGLLQVIPKTGELIAQRMGRVDFGPDDLFDPEVAIEFGCYYFGELMTKFSGQELLAFAGYNGGPHNVARWLEGWGDLPMDAFIEMIPRQQPREYTKKVLRHLALYRQIYLGEGSVFVGQQVDPHYRDNIHF